MKTIESEDLDPFTGFSVAELCGFIYIKARVLKDCAKLLAKLSRNDLSPHDDHYTGWRSSHPMGDDKRLSTPTRPAARAYVRDMDRGSQMKIRELGRIDSTKRT